MFERLTSELLELLELPGARVGSRAGGVRGRVGLLQPFVHLLLLRDDPVLNLRSRLGRPTACCTPLPFCVV